MIKQANIRSVLCFYGFKTPSLSSQKAALEACLSLFEVNDLSPDRAAIKARGFSGKVGVAKRILSKFFKNHVENLESIFVVRSHCDISPAMMDWDAYYEIANDSGLIILGIDQVKCPVSDLYRSLPTEVIINKFQPSYGFGYEMPLSQGPNLYAGGVFRGGNGVVPIFSKEEDNFVSFWCQKAKLEECYNKGFIRDLFPVNFFSDIQLNHKFEETTLGDWISNCDFGETTRVGHLTCWSISDKNVAKHKERFRLSGAVATRSTFV